MSFGKYIKLRNGANVPQIGLGTWLSKPKEVENAVCTIGLFARKLFNDDPFGLGRLNMQLGMDIGISILRWFMRIKMRSVLG